MGAWSASGARPISSVYWRIRALVACNYATGTKAEITGKACDLLTACDDWTKLDDLERAGFVSSSSFAATIDRLVELTLLERSDRPSRSPRPARWTRSGLEPAGRLLPRDHQGRAVRVADGLARAARARQSRPRLLRRPSSATPASRPSTFRGPNADGRARERAARAPHVASLLGATGHHRGARDDPGPSPPASSSGSRAERSPSRSRRRRPAVRATPPSVTSSLATSRD